MEPVANLASVLKAEIARLARREAKAAVEPLRKANAAYRRDIAALKREVAALQRQLKSAAKENRPRDAAPADAGEGRRLRFQAKGLKSHREKLGLSAAEYGQLAGVSAQSIYNWEAGKTVPRQAQVAALAELRGMGKREANRRLEAADAE
ncbi:MAG: helix-turn-helix transcriptional regulator [Gammaproteobacteria bacterium]|nr:helix-turn-helix transcriptional regulator [Gammaproteobacteria bacterium]